MNNLFLKNTCKGFLNIHGLFRKNLLTGMILCGILLSGKQSFAAHPLITDDASTQGKGGIQIELNGEYEHGKNDGVTEDVYEIAGMLTYGLIEKLDLVFGLPYLYTKTKEDEETVKEKGISDAAFEAKWRFFEKDIFAFAFKPGFSFPTGDYKKGLGTGKTGYSGYFISTTTLEPLVFHINLGYIRNENKLDEEKNLWHASLAAEYSIIKNLRLVANIGMDRNTDPEGSDKPAFLIGGFIYSPVDNIDLDGGLKYSFAGETHFYSILAGLTARF